MRLSPGTGGKGWFSKDGQVWENGALDGLWLPSDHPTVPLPETSTPQLHLPLGTLTHPSTGGGAVLPTPGRVSPPWPPHVTHKDMEAPEGR